uniref:Translocon-associated protein subunit delta n=1 Tax=Steinernema glaseri TaxID=37863 RepID=A0A1I8ANM0_9BILA
MFGKLIALSAVLAVALGTKCEAPKVSASSFSTTDGFFHFSSTFIVEFTLQCSNNVKEMPVFAVVNDKIYQAAVSEETSKYQITWLLPHSEAYSRTFDVQIFDEDSISAYKKAQREGQDTAAVKPLYTHQFVHAGVSKQWPVSPESLSVLVSIAVFSYVFFGIKSKYDN